MMRPAMFRPPCTHPPLWISAGKLVGARGFEPPTPTMSTRGNLSVHAGFRVLRTTLDDTGKQSLTRFARTLHLPCGG